MSRPIEGLDSLRAVRTLRISLRRANGSAWRLKPEGSGTALVRAEVWAIENRPVAGEGGASYLPDASTEVDSQSSGEAG